ncbi:bZIP transcription factor 50 [Elaeis guineensis]|uniref:BZIP transcription factor 50 n=1 Tax=Elaeis guineensis var. tenera TaxID=51953 RepID=A0A6I9QRE8_ELAGV|nr:bZIP transcription factor 50 [Elaeis guineensis]
MGDVVEAPTPDFLGDLDFDRLLEGFFNDSALDLSPELWNSEPSPDESKFAGSVSTGRSTERLIPEPPPEQSDSPDSMHSFVNEIEKFLMEDGGGGEDVIDDEFLAGFFSDVSADSGKSEVASPEAEPVPAAVESEAKEKREASAAVDVEDDDPISKKRRRQMRNRDSAMKSRERKKIYIKELEMKSKYLESECRRLNYALQCCSAENLTLHQRLQERTLGVPVARQESAVLFVESLLLGSLFWLVSIMFLFLVPGLPQPRKVASSLERGLAHREIVVTGRVTSERVEKCLGLDLSIMRRRCRGSRSRMKFCLFLFCMVGLGTVQH